MWLHLPEKTGLFLKSPISKPFKPWFLLLLLLANALPILIYSPFPSLDIPAHVYNAELLKQLILSRDTVALEFHSMHPDLIPNWTSHVLLILLGLVFNANTAVSIYLLALAIGLPLAFYALIRKLSPGNEILAVFSLPFVYSYLYLLNYRTSSKMQFLK